MIGKLHIEIGEKDFLNGVTTSPHSSDGGFSPETNGVSLTHDNNKIGTLYPPVDPSDLTGVLGTNLIIASSSDNKTGVSAIQKAFVTDAGQFYTMDTTYYPTLRQTASGTFTLATTDLVSFTGEFFITTETDIVRIRTVTNPYDTIDNTWWSTTRGHGTLAPNVRHPLLSHLNNLWIGDDNKIHRYDGITLSSSAAALTLSSEQSVVALGVDPSSNKILISVTEGSNAGNTLPKLNRVMVWDGTSGVPNKMVVVEDMVTSFHTVGGVTYCFYGKNLGYWNGSGVTFLRKLKGVTNDGYSLVYKHKATVADKTLYYMDGLQIMAMEDVIQGQKRFYPITTITDELNQYLGTIGNLGDDKVGYSYTNSGGTDKYYIYDKTVAGLNSTLNFYSRKYKFPRPIFFRNVYIEFVDGIPADTTPGSLSIIDQAGNTYALSSIENTSDSNIYSIKSIGAGSVKFTSLQLLYSGSRYGISRFIIYYDIAE